MRGGREPGHVDADLGDGRLRRPFPDPGDGVEPVTGPFEGETGLAGVRGEQRVDLRVELGGGGFEMRGVLEAQPDQQCVVLAEPAPQRLTQLGDLLAEPGLGQLGEDLGIAFTNDERSQHRPPRHAQHVRRPNRA